MKELVQRVEEGRLARDLLDSQPWQRLLKPMLTSFRAGLLDASDIDVSSDKKASIEIKSRVLAAEYVDKIQSLLEAYVTDGEVAQKLLTPPEQREPLTREL